MKFKKNNAKKTILFMLTMELLLIFALVVTLNCQDKKNHEQMLKYYPVVTKSANEVDISTQSRVPDLEKDLSNEIRSVEPEVRIYDNLEELARCVQAEAGNQSPEGKRMVAAVILNRVDHADFPNTVKGVIEQHRGIHYQFSSFADGSMKSAEPTEGTYEAIQLEISERKYPTIFFFRTKRYSDYGKPAWKFEDHYFNTL